MLPARRLWSTALSLAALCGCNGQARPLRLGTTHTVEQSGALALLDSSRPPLRLVTIVAPSGQILRAAAAGNLDVVVTHAPSLEQRILVAPGRAALRCPFVTSRFALVGPPADPARAGAARSAADAFRRIAARRAPFVSRGDSSGTHVRELALWRAALDGTPEGAPWYVETGGDQATTLRVADERQAYALADLPTWTRLAPAGLRIVFTADSALVNAYTLYVIRSPAPHPAAAAFRDWALTAWRAPLLALRLEDGAAGFVSAEGGCTVPP